MNKKILLFSLASISCIPVINQVCSNYNSRNTSLVKNNCKEINSNLFSLNSIDANETINSPEYDNEIPNYSKSKES